MLFSRPSFFIISRSKATFFLRCSSVIRGAGRAFGGSRLPRLSRNTFGGGQRSQMRYAVAEKFKSALGIHSPSRVFMGFGDNIAQGAAIGIGRSAGLASKAAAGMASDTAAAAQRINAGRAGAGASAGGAGGMTIHFSPTIQVQGGAAEAVKGQVTEVLNLSLRELEQLIARVSAQQARRAY